MGMNAKYIQGRKSFSFTFSVTNDTPSEVVLFGRERDPARNLPSEPHVECQCLCVCSSNNAKHIIKFIPKLTLHYNTAVKNFTHTQPFYGRCQKRTSGLYGARED